MENCQQIYASGEGKVGSLQKGWTERVKVHTKIQLAIGHQGLVGVNGLEAA